MCACIDPGAPRDSHNTAFFVYSTSWFIGVGCRLAIQPYCKTQIGDPVKHKMPAAYDYVETLDRYGTSQISERVNNGLIPHDHIEWVAFT